MPIWNPILPPGIIALITLGLVGLLAYGSFLLTTKRVPSKWIAILAGLRMIIILLFVLCLLQPMVSCSRTVKRGPPILVFLDTSQSMDIKDSAGRNRLQETLQWMEKSGLLKKLVNRPNVFWFAFDQSARPIEPADLKTLQANGKTTHIADSLVAAWDYYRQQSGQRPSEGTVPGRVLMVSDFNDLGSRDPVSVAQAAGLTVDTLVPSSTPDKGSAGADVAIANVRNPSRVLKDSETRFLVTLRQTGMENVPLTINLKEGKTVLADQHTSFSPGQEEKQVSLAYRPSEAGIKEYEVEVISNPPDSLQSNNHSKITMRVLNDKNEILFLEDNWRWEFKFLRHIFEDDPSFALTAFLARGNKAFSHFVEHDHHVNLSGFPQSKAELERFDSFILGDVNPKNWPVLARGINKLVIEEGKSLILIAGAKNLAEIADVPEIASILPVEITRETAIPKPGPIKVQVSAEGIAAPFFFAAATQATADLWSNLPPLDQIYMPVRKRPGATVILEAPELRSEYGGSAIVVAEHTVGRGRVLYVGTDTLWKWHTAAIQSDPAVSPYIVFWQQALRALAPSRLSTGNVNLWLQPEHSRYETGQTVNIRAEIQADRGFVKPRIQASVTLPDGKKIPLDFAARATEANFYVASFETTMGGQHKIFAELLSDGKLAASEVTAIEVEESQAEQVNLKINDANMTRIASDTGGKVINRNDPKTWPTDKNIEPLSVSQTRTFDLWNNFSLLILLSCLLGADWLLRLLRGYV